MLVSLKQYARQGEKQLQKWMADSRLHAALRLVGAAGAGFLLSAASLAQYAMPLAMALVLSGSGWTSLAGALGAVAGCRVFWGSAADQAVAWILAALPVALILGGSAFRKKNALLLPAIGALITAAWGVVFQLLYFDTTPVPVYLLRVGLGFGATLLLCRLRQGRNVILQWLAAGLGVLALAQIAPVSWLNLGFLAAGILSSAGAFPAAALAGLALDLSQVSRLPMAAVLAMSYLPRFLPGYPRWGCVLTTAAVTAAMMALQGVWQPELTVSLLLGSAVGSALPIATYNGYRRGETGVAQVRLEMAAGVMAQTQQQLLEFSDPQIDCRGLVCRAAEQACSGCSCRKGCRDSQRLQQLPGTLLQKPLHSIQELPIVCRRSGRFLAQLHRAQEQQRLITAHRQHREEYRQALVQQYGFLAQYLRGLSDSLSRRDKGGKARFSPQLTVYGNRPAYGNGDRCVRFAGVGNLYYIALCDGMGTGPGAVQEGQSTIKLLSGLLGAGYPASHALRSVNALCALRERAGAVTVDLAELCLESGKVTLYKWGAAPSYLIGPGQVLKLGSTCPPPGLSVTGEQEQVEHTSLRRGEWLVLVSDGISEQEALRLCREGAAATAQELALELMNSAQLGGQDDATVAVLQLKELA